MKEESRNILEMLEEERLERLRIEEDYKSTQAVMDDETQTLRSNIESASRRQLTFQLPKLSKLPKVACQVLWFYH